MTVFDRFNEVFKSLNITQSQFATELEISQRDVSLYCNGKVKYLKEDVIQSLNSKFDVNLVWLFTGQGKMFNSIETFENKLSTHNIGVTTAPLIGQYAQIGFLSGYNDKDFLDKQPIYYAIQNYGIGNYVAFEVKDDSMDNDSRTAICSGDVVLGVEVPRSLWGNKLPTPKVYVILHKTEGILIREVIEHDVDNETITCSAYNLERLRFPDFVLNLKEVIGVFVVKEIKRGGI